MLQRRPSAAGVVDMGSYVKLLQTAMMHAAAAAVRPYGVHNAYTSVSAFCPHSPVSPADRSAPLGRRVSGDGVLRAMRANCTK